MSSGKIVAIYISPDAGAPMLSVKDVPAIAREGLLGDRYCKGEGSFNKGKVGRRQVTLINARFIPQSWRGLMTRRNIVTEGVELNWLVGREFRLCDGVVMRGVKYCDPCKRPSKLLGIEESFQEVFFDCGGIVAEILEEGLLTVGGTVVPPPKGY